MNVKDRIKTSLIDAIVFLSPDVKEKIYLSHERETAESGKLVLNAIKENIKIAEEKHIPLCQDTGMFWCFAEIGKDSNCNIAKLESIINEACKEAAIEEFYRKSVVTDPIYKRTNTKTNMPAIINYGLIDGDKIIISFLLKGFGSENCSSVRMLNPTVGEAGVVNAVVDIMEKAGGKPCPPTFIGVGVGGTMDRAALLSKRAFFKKEEETELEKRIRTEINKLGIGAGGLGGINSCLSVQLLSEPTHIAGLPVAVTVNCWADRKVQLVFNKEDFQ